MSLDISIGAAVAAGVLSFLSPCVLPLVPPYLCYISGVSLEDLTAAENPDAKKHRWTVLLTGFVFVLGFTTVFTLLGASASFAGQLLRLNIPIPSAITMLLPSLGTTIPLPILMSYLGGLLIITMGFHFLGLFKIAILSREARYHREGPSVGLWGAYFIGLAFAFGWTPCIGPVLTVILSLAGQSENVSRGMMLLTAYSLGLGIPFLIAAFSVDSFLSFFRKFRRHMALVEKLMGVALVITGIAFLTGGMQSMSYWLLEIFPSLGSIG